MAPHSRKNVGTPWKINMEPTNHPFRKENDLIQTSRELLFSMLIFRGVHIPIILLMDEILHQLIGSLSHCITTGFYTCQVVQDFFHQQYGASGIHIMFFVFSHGFLWVP